MPVGLIYLDTTIWNVLSEQNPRASKVCQSLAERSLGIVLGLNAYFEMLRSFYGKRPDAGKRLFQPLHSRRFISCSERILLRCVCYRRQGRTS